MGCDIHAHLEIEGVAEQSFVALFHGAVDLPRDYRVFRALAGVRGENPPLFSPRGIPDVLSDAAFEGYYLFVIDPAQSDLYRGFNFVTLSEAEDYVRSGQVTRVPAERKRTGLLSPYGYITETTWHTPSWLFFSEIWQALEYSGLREDDLLPEYRVLLETMASLERHMGRRSRLVFWFDN